MAFTDRFIRVPIHVFDKKIQELTGQAPDIETWCAFNPMELSNYKPSYDEGEPEVEITHMTLKNGYGALVYLPPAEFEKLLNDYQK